MDQKDLLLIKAHNALQSTRALLEKILDDDDDAVLSARVIGEAGEEETMNTEIQQPTPETPIQRLRREIFKRVSDLSHGVTPEAAQQFYDGMLWSYPAINRRAIFERFKDERYSYPEMPANPRSTTTTARYGDDVRIRMDAILEIICLFEDLHSVDPSNDIMAQVKASRARYERVMFKGESRVDKLRREAFAEIARLSGKSETKVAAVYDRIPWKALRVDRFAEVEAEIMPPFPDTFVGRQHEPKNDLEWEKLRQAERERIAHRDYALEARNLITRIIENLHGETGAERTKELTRAAREHSRAA